MLTVSTIYISLNSVKVVHFTHNSCFPFVPVFVRPLNTSEVSGRNSLRDIYKESLTYENPQRFQAKADITLPNENGALTRNISAPQEDRAIPWRCIPSFPFGKIIIR
jgi:hypothetical protein